MSETDFLKRADNHFAKPCLKHFSFLKSEFGLRFSGTAISHEAVASYSNDKICIEIVFEIPVAPFVNFQKVEGGKIKEEYIYKPKNKKITQLIKDFNKHRDKISFESWFECFKSGKLDKIFDRLLFLLANAIRPKIPKILEGDFSVIND
jgi:hypothetical protein